MGFEFFFQTHCYMIDSLNVLAGFLFSFLSHVHIYFSQRFSSYLSIFIRVFFLYLHKLLVMHPFFNFTQNKTTNFSEMKRTWLFYILSATINCIVLYKLTAKKIYKVFQNLSFLFEKSQLSF